ncbi:MAG: DEAD/DEAH box helicase [Clostridiales bacterium]|nr:DEAD/DEAH box helicase [Clostridiales bacterium]
MIALHSISMGDPAFVQGEALYRRGSVSQAIQSLYELRYDVGTVPVQTVSFLRNGTAACTCGNGSALCEHIAAAYLAAENDGSMKRFQKEWQLHLGQQMLGALTRAMPGGESIRLVAQLRLYDDGRIGLGLSAGQDRLYAIRSIPELLYCFSTGTALPLSPKSSYQPEMMRFTREDEHFLSSLLSYVPLKAPASTDDFSFPDPGREQTSPELLPPPSEGRFLILNGPFLQSVMRSLENYPFILLHPEGKQPHNGIKKKELPLCFAIALSPTELTVHVEGTNKLHLITPDGRYVLSGNTVTRLHSAQAKVCRLLLTEGSSFTYPAKDAEETLAILLPALSAVGTVAPSQELSARLVSQPLKPSIYLDLEHTNVVARVEFHYGDAIIYPFAKADNTETKTSGPILEDGRMLLRDGRAESALLDQLSGFGFVVHNGNIILRRSRDILYFCTQGVSELAKRCDIFASKAFEKVKPRRFTATSSFRMRGGRLIFSLLEDGKPVEELAPILNAIAQRQQYVRLKTGEFLDVRDMMAFSPLMQEMLDAAKLDKLAAEEPSERELNFRSYRAAYMVTMFRMAGVDPQTDEESENAILTLTQPSQKDYMPSRLRKKMTEYQCRGSDWLLSLYEARMGGVLADEMGLGKTLQVIAALSAAKRKDGTKKSIIVTPTSLTYHWLAELKRFDDSLRVRVITGQRTDRRHAIADLKQDDSVDVILTSYPLLRRDIDYLKDIPLRFAVLDEAQSVKNAQSQGALAAKELDAQVRIALTGTPMENHTGELWSIFDFVLPGYLGTQASFLRRYGGGELAEELRERIRPFLMRRLKSEVMTQLPEKRESYLYAAMTPEQERIYQTLLETLRQNVGSALENGSLPKARMQVLSLLLKLRQVCCHPKLFLDDYDGTSGKLELLIQTVHSSIASGHRLLVFSQFVGMLQIIKKRLSREGVQALYLDGDTKPEQRQQLCDRFNGGDGKVFLISLKAGGTGLNLIGADLVIHFDPWWNPAAEDQATDRAHRIGQTRDVDVIKMITQGSIEEKVTELSKRKRAIFDRVIISGETSLSSLTEEDIRALFFS